MRAGSIAWFVWGTIPKPLRRYARVVVAAARRARARSTPVPAGPSPPLPAEALELRTLYGSFWFDGADRKMVPWIRRHATWEADVLRLMSATLLAGGTAVDVGANVGFLTVAMSRLVGPAGTVHAFEPLPVTVELLRANLWRHACVNATIHANAVSNLPGAIRLEPDPAGRSGAHLGELGIEAEAVTLDQALPDTRVALIKIDVEGAEPLVLRGATELLAASPDLVAVVEFRDAQHLDGSSPEEVLAFYETLGFELCLLLVDGRPHPASHTEIMTAAARTESLNIVLKR